MNTDDFSVVTETVIGCAMKVSNALGAGFLEKVYENALAHELRAAGLALVQCPSEHFRRDYRAFGA